MKPSIKAVQLIKQREKCKLSVYPDKDGNLTIGWGHLLTKADSYMLAKGFKLTQKQADDLFLTDLQKHTVPVVNAIKVAVNQNQWDALVSITFNFGYLPQPISRAINLGYPLDYVSNLFNNYTQSAGSFLKKVRKAESILFSTGKVVDIQSVRV